MNLKARCIAFAVLTACSGSYDAEEAALQEASIDYDAESARDRCAAGGKFDFQITGRDLWRGEGRRVVAAALENDLWAGATRQRRVVLRSGSIRGGGFTLGCARALRENYGYPSYGAFIDMDGNGRCNKGDLGYQMMYYGWNQDVREAIPATGWQDTARLSPPIGSSAKDFCAGYFR